MDAARSIEREKSEQYGRQIERALRDVNLRVRGEKINAKVREAQRTKPSRSATRSTAT
jgi:hypothetical protein